MDNVQKALALARLGIKVFPVDLATRQPFKGGSGFYDATSDDWEKIATWFSLDHPESTTAVAYWTGGSDLFVTDVDYGKKNGKDGYKTLAEVGLDRGDTHSYETASGGKHLVFSTEGLDEDAVLALGPDQDHSGLEGIDIRAGGSYAVWWGDEVPETREAFSRDIPEWMLTSATKPKLTESATHTGFGGGADEWLDSVSDEPLPSGRVAEFMARIPTEDFGHVEMVELAWEIVRLGAERETGIKPALEKLRAEWLRPPYDRAKYRRDLASALSGAIKKAGRIQHHIPVISLTKSDALALATKAGIRAEITDLERRAVDAAADSNELEMSRVRRGLFEACFEAGLSASAAMSLVAASKSAGGSAATHEAWWFGEGEPVYHDSLDGGLGADAGSAAAVEDVEETLRQASFAEEAEKFSLLTVSETEEFAKGMYSWWGDEYLEWVQSRLDYFNRPYHVMALWMVLSVIVSPWGRYPKRGSEPVALNLYGCAFGMTSSGKSEALGFAQTVIDAYYDPAVDSALIGNVDKMSANALHDELVRRDGKASMVYSDEVQKFFKNLENAKWKDGLIGDLADYYGGKVSPKLVRNDSELSGKRARCLLTAYFTGIQETSLAHLTEDNWAEGFLPRFLWAFGYPREAGAYDISMEDDPRSYTAKPEEWARTFAGVRSTQEFRWGPNRLVGWEDDAVERIMQMHRDIDEVTSTERQHDDIFAALNGRFRDSIMKCATLVALAENSEKVQLRHVLIAISYAGPWHRSMVIAVREVSSSQSEREAARLLGWIKRNVVIQIGKRPWIQRSTVMRGWRKDWRHTGDLLTDLCEKGYLIRNGDVYEITEE